MMNSEARKRKEEAEDKGVVSVTIGEALDHVIFGLTSTIEMLKAIMAHLEGRSDESDKEA